jgi:purine-cytosine permease-like protein
LLGGFDLVIGYLVSWCLMFADYTRFQREEGAASRAVFGGMAITSFWLMALGAGAGLLGGGNDPTDMVLGAGLPIAALVLMALSTITTNFVNLFLSALALKNLWPKAPDRATVLGVGAIGTGLGLVSPQILDRYAAFMGYLGTALLPIVAVVLVHFFTGPRIADPLAAPRLRLAAVFAWLAGAAVYQGIQLTPWPFGATLPTLATTALLYAALRGRFQGGS